MIFDYKNQLETAEDRILFEEFVKYKELRSTFDLYMLTGITLKATAQVSNSNEISGGAGYSSTGPEVHAQDSLTISKTQGANITFSIVPLADQPTTYEKVKDVFKKFQKKEIYDLIYPTNSNNDNENSQEIKAGPCPQALLCVRVKGLTNPQGLPAWGYLTKEKVKCFRALKDRLVKAGIFEQITQTPKPSPSDPPKIRVMPFGMAHRHYECKKT